jgi:hypothetical protein
VNKSLTIDYSPLTMQNKSEIQHPKSKTFRLLPFSFRPKKLTSPFKKRGQDFGLFKGIESSPARRGIAD